MLLQLSPSSMNNNQYTTNTQSEYQSITKVYVLCVASRWRGYIYSQQHINCKDITTFVPDGTCERGGRWIKYTTIYNIIQQQSDI